MQVEEHFPRVTQLKIWTYRIFAPFDLSPFCNMIRLNPQIRCLELEGTYITELLRCASKHLEFLEQLHIFTFKQGIFLKEVEREFMDFAYLKKLKVTCMGDISNIPILSRCLQEFSLHTDFIEMDIIIDFLKKHPSITKLNLAYHSYVIELEKFRITDTEYLIGIIKALPWLEEMVVTMVKIPVNAAIKFVKKCRSLQKLCFSVDDHADFDYISTCLEVEWQTKMTKHNNPQSYDITIVKRQHTNHQKCWNTSQK